VEANISHYLYPKLVVKPAADGGRSVRRRQLDTIHLRTGDRFIWDRERLIMHFVSVQNPSGVLSLLTNELNSETGKSGRRMELPWPSNEQEARFLVYVYTSAQSRGVEEQSTRTTITWIVR